VAPPRSRLAPRASGSQVDREYLGLVGSLREARSVPVSLGEIVADVAHEIANPLAFVLSHLDTTPAISPKAAPSPEHMTQTVKEKSGPGTQSTIGNELGLERIRELVDNCARSHG
jgi:signal transduction histidine kinase